MTFLVPLGLLVAAAVVGPLLAHLLRRRRPEERPFPPARLVPTAPPVARRRAHIEDRALLALRALAVLLLALLAASPLVKCTRLALDRRGGSSIALALVIDDSMSMRAELPNDARRGGAKTRFELALVAATELADSLRPGDTTTIVLAGAPARVLLPPTSEAGSVKAALDALGKEGPTDRATDLDGAIALASTAIHDLPHADHRVVLLSDLADGSTTEIAPPPGERLDLEAPVDALRATPPQGAGDCAVISATPEGNGDQVRVHVACSTKDPRTIELARVDATRTVLGRAATPPDFALAPDAFDVLVPIDRDKIQDLSPADGKPRAFARLSGVDAIATDDQAPVLGASTAPTIGVVVGEAGALDEVVATGGAPVVERALEALVPNYGGDLTVRPLPTVPDQDADLSTLAGLAIDDPPGFGPEARAALGKWVEGGGVLLLAVGPRAAAPPLGQDLAPFLERAVKYEKAAPHLGVDPSNAGPFGAEANAPKDLGAKGRSILDPEDVGHFAVRAKWTDGAPLLLTRVTGQGEVWAVDLPFAPDESDLPLQPAFLSLLDAFVARARDRGADARLEVGQAWSAGLDDTLDVAPIDPIGALGAPLPVDKGDDAIRVRPRAIGAYLVTTTHPGGQAHRDVRAIAPSPREVDLRPRPLAASIAAGNKSGLQRSTVELTPTIAWALMILVLLELLARVARMFMTPREEAPAVEE